ncbi:hypothetical protein K0504_10350 [Neiella marina]|uniref:Uncharacterized protein n=1 Tax=Neiella holothuriorum TaxID=2870530 RepID=A0ABS7EIG9_9GAMM|nr:hypothetical protein [Neiella holothuriorum]MBW8191437.1 hypothetical protein [Neiella holothuriorum]
MSKFELVNVDDFFKPAINEPFIQGLDDLAKDIDFADPGSFGAMPVVTKIVIDDECLHVGNRRTQNKTQFIAGYLSAKQAIEYTQSIAVVEEHHFTHVLSAFELLYFELCRIPSCGQRDKVQRAFALILHVQERLVAEHFNCISHTKYLTQCGFSESSHISDMRGYTKTTGSEGNTFAEIMTWACKIELLCQSVGIDLPALVSSDEQKIMLENDEVFDHLPQKNNANSTGAASSQDVVQEVENEDPS